MELSVSGVGVLDKAVTILDALELGSRSLAELVDVTGISRATAHRLALALEVHGLVERDDDGRFALGARMAGSTLVRAARPALEWLRDETGESVQLYVPRGDVRVCVVSLESPHSLRTIVPVGATLPMDRGSAAKVFQPGARDWYESVEEREKGVASATKEGVRGDQIVELQIVVPEARDLKVRELWQELQKLEPADPRKDMWLKI